MAPRATTNGKKPSFHLKQIHKHLTKYMNLSKKPCGFIYLSKRKVKIFGTKYLKRKLRNSASVLKRAMKKDNDSLANVTGDVVLVHPNLAYKETTRVTNFKKLDFPLKYMGIEELRSVLSEYVWASYLISGGTDGRILYNGDYKYCPAWWPEQMMPWADVRNFTGPFRYTGPGSKVDFFRHCITECLTGINIVLLELQMNLHEDYAKYDNHRESPY